MFTFNSFREAEEVEVVFLFIYKLKCVPFKLRLVNKQTNKFLSSRRVLCFFLFFSFFLAAAAGLLWTLIFYYYYYYNMRLILKKAALFLQQQLLLLFIITSIQNKEEDQIQQREPFFPWPDNFIKSVPFIIIITNNFLNSVQNRNRIDELNRVLSPVAVYYI